MAINVEAIKARLASLNKKPSAAKDSIWKPTSGKQVIRIVPYQHNPENPFIELKFHYSFGGKTYLSPASFNRPDPIVELSDKLKRSGDNDNWQVGRTLEPKLRTFLPVIVRGQEDKGVRFWGFGVQVFKQLMATIGEPAYGDITDLNEGYDVQVEFVEAKDSKKSSKDGRKFPETTILVLPKQRPAVDPKNPKAAELLELITKKQPNILDTYTEATYTELKAALETYMNEAKAGQSEEESNVVEPTDEQIAAATPPAKVVDVKAETPKETLVSPSAKKATATNAEELSAAFDNMFNS